MSFACLDATASFRHLLLQKNPGCFGIQVPIYSSHPGILAIKQELLGLSVGRLVVDAVAECCIIIRGRVQSTVIQSYVGQLMVRKLTFWHYTRVVR